MTAPYPCRVPPTDEWCIACLSPWRTTSVRHATLQSALILPVLPVHIMKLKVTGNSDANCRKEEALAELREQSEPLELVLHGVLELGKAQRDAHRVQLIVQLRDHIACGDVDAGDRLCSDDQPPYRSWRRRHRIQHALLEQFGVGEEQGRIPPEQDQPRYPARIGISRDVMIAFDAVRAPQHGRVRPPAIPQELDDRHRDGQTDSRYG